MNKISTPGVYDISIDAYHSDCCNGPSVSSSGLRTCELKSPAHFWGQWYGNPGHQPVADSEAFKIGRAAHHLFLGEEGFAKHYVHRPEKLDGALWNGNRKACREWLEYVEAQGLTVLTPTQVEAIHGMADSLSRHPLAGGLLSGQVEQSLIWQDQTGLWAKARPDIIPDADGVVADLKCLASVTTDAVQRAIGEHGYHMQLALAEEGMRRLMNLNVEAHVLICVEKTHPYAVNIITVDPEDIWLGHAQNRRALDTIASCLASGEWPVSSIPEPTVGLPKWRRDRLQWELDNHLLPNPTERMEAAE